MIQEDRMTKRIFKADEIKAMGLPYEAPEGGEIISDRITSNSRWSIHHEIIFRLPGQPPGEAWRALYSHGATEQQMETPWEYEDEVEATLVREVERTVKVWEPS